MNTEKFIDDLYRSALNRVPEWSGFDCHRNYLYNAGLNPTAFKQVAASFYRSAEFGSLQLSNQEKSERLYNGILGRPSDAPGLAVQTWAIGYFGFDQILKNFMDSPEFNDSVNSPLNNRPALKFKVTALNPNCQLPELPTFGYEGGYAVQIGSQTHLFVTEIGKDWWLSTQIAHWVQKSGVWTRLGTVSQSYYDGKTYFDIPWAQPFRFENNYWNLYSVEYDSAFYGSNGRIIRSVAAQPGIDGIYSGFQNVEIVMDMSSRPARTDWMGNQGIAGFTPFTGLKGEKLAFIQSHSYSQDSWNTGLFQKINGKWQSLNEWPIISNRIENPIIGQINGQFVMLYDTLSLGQQWSIGFATSPDGTHWSNGQSIQIPGANCFDDIRTPQSLIDNGDGTYEVLFTAKEKRRNYWGQFKATVTFNSPSRPPLTADFWIKNLKVSDPADFVLPNSPSDDRLVLCSLAYQRDRAIRRFDYKDGRIILAQTTVQTAIFDDQGHFLRYEHSVNDVSQRAVGLAFDSAPDNFWMRQFPNYSDSQLASKLNDGQWHRVLDNSTHEMVMLRMDQLGSCF